MLLSYFESLPKPAHREQVRRIKQTWYQGRVPATPEGLGWSEAT